MAKEKQPIIIKKIQAGHAGAHGGAWKVAYADFVTAMMAFFMVMWLMGSDDETKAAVASYFNNPTSAWRRDLVAKETLPLGDRTGAGDNILNGAGGAVPEDQVKRPSRPYAQYEESKGQGELLERLISDKQNFEMDLIRFSVSEDLLFEPGTPDQWRKGSEKIVEKVGQLSKIFKGKITIEGTHPKESADEKTNPAGKDSNYEFHMSRLVSVSKLLVEKRLTEEDRIQTAMRPDEQSADGERRPSKITFTLYKKPGDE